MTDPKQIPASKWREYMKEYRLRNEIPACAAIKLKNGALLAGRRHPNCLDSLRACGYTKYEIVTQGFMTTWGRFVEREEAMQLMIAAGLPSHDPDGYRGQELFSEDLY